MKKKARYLKAAISCALLWFCLAYPAFAAPATVEGFRSFLASFRAEAIGKGIRPSVYDTVTRTLTPDFSLPDLDIPSTKAPEPRDGR